MNQSASLKIISAQIEGFPQLDPESRRQLIKELHKVATVERGAAYEPESVCPVTKEGLRLPCGLKRCQYWVDHAWTKNCSLHYMALQRAESMTIDQISMLFGIAPDRIDSIYRRCFKIVQRNYLKLRLQESGIPQFHYLTGFCVECQTRLESEELNNPNLRLLDGEHGYCSEDCKRQRPPHIFEIEKFFTTEFKNVLKLGIKLFSFHYLEEVLGFQANVLRKQLEKQGDFDLPTKKRGRRTKLPGLKG